MYNGNYPNDYEENRGQAEGGAQQSDAGGQYGQNSTDSRSEPGSAGGQYGHDGYQYHNYYNDRYRGGRNGYQGQDSFNGHQSE